MIQLGFVSAILPDLNLEEVLSFASNVGYDCVEVMCWPPGKAERRYAGVTHIDVSELTPTYIKYIQELTDKYGVGISGLGYYPNPLSHDHSERPFFVSHIKQVIAAAAALGINKMNTFVGRDHTLSIEDNWPDFQAMWTGIIQYAEEKQVKVGIENCPMFFTNDEWPGGKNLAISPSVWRKMFQAIPSPNFGLNYDPSHMVLQHMDYLAPMRDFADRFFHVHAKDLRIDREKLDQVGVFSNPNLWHTPKLPGLGDVDWGRFFSTLTSVGYEGPVCVEVEDRAYEGSLEKRKLSLIQSHTYLRQFVPKSS